MESLMSYPSCVSQLAVSNIDTSSASDVAAVVLTGLAVVFSALILLIIFVWIYRMIFDKIRTSKKSNTVPVPSAPKPDPQKMLSQPEEEEAEEEEVSLINADEEVVAVISAVIAQISAETGTAYALKSLKPVETKRSRRSLWALEGIRGETNPF